MNGGQEEDMKEGKELGTFFALIDIIETHLQNPQATETDEKVWSKWLISLV